MTSRGRSSSRSSGGDDIGPSQRSTISLVPKEGGFDLQPSKLVLDVSKAAYKSRIAACWPKWDSIPAHILECIWQDVLAELDIQTDDLMLARHYWMQKMRKNYRDTISGVKAKRKKPTWMGESVWEGFLKYWDSDDAKAEAERNSANRNMNPVIHRGGSKPFQQYRQELEAEGKGPVTYMDVFTRTHAVEQLNPDGSISYRWEDDKSRLSHEKFMAERQRLLEETGRDQLTPDEEDVIFQSVMDPPSRNRRYGFGSQVASSQRRGRQTRADIDLAEIEELRDRVAQLEDQNRRQSIEMTQLLDQRIAEYMQQYGGRFPSSAGSGGSADG